MKVAKLWAFPLRWWTLRRPNARKRRESETHLRHMMEFSSQIVLILDSKGRALEVRHCWIEVTGMNDEQWRGLGWINAVHPEDLPAVWDALHRSFATGQPMDVKYRIQKPAEAPWK